MMGAHKNFVLPGSTGSGSKKISACEDPESFLEKAFSEAQFIIEMFPHAKDMQLLKNGSLISKLEDFLAGGGGRQLDKEHELGDEIELDVRRKLRVVFRKIAMTDPAGKAMLDLMQEYKRQCNLRFAGEADEKQPYGLTIIDNKICLTRDSWGDDFVSGNAPERASILSGKFEALFRRGIHPKKMVSFHP
jgi:hypothetical protein